VLVALVAITTELVFVVLQHRLTPRGLRLQQPRSGAEPEPEGELAAA
jgi:hypothetical protein